MSHLPTVVDARLEEWSPVHWAFHVWSWIVLLTLFVVLEVWADLLLASLVLCLKFGWRDLLVAMRLHSHKNRPMAVVLRRYCLALACIKVALTGILVTSAVITCQTLLGIHPQLGRFLAGYIPLICGLMFGEIIVLFAG